MMINQQVLGHWIFLVEYRLLKKTGKEYPIINME